MEWGSVTKGALRHNIDLRNHPSRVPTLYNAGEGNMEPVRYGECRLQLPGARHWKEGRKRKEEHPSSRLASLGANDIPREEFTVLLCRLLGFEKIRGNWGFFSSEESASDSGRLIKMVWVRTKLYTAYFFLHSLPLEKPISLALNGLVISN
jgi:hypothetical protein